MPSDQTVAFQKFADYLSAIEKLEKRLPKIYLKMEKAAFTPELAKCLDPESTESEQHLKRIGLLKTAIQQKGNVTLAAEDLTIKLTKASIEQDLTIIATALKMQHQKLAYYELLHPLAAVLFLTTAAELIEQTISDNRNTCTWLRQIIQNIIVPKLA